MCTIYYAFWFFVWSVKIYLYKLNQPSTLYGQFIDTQYVLHTQYIQYTYTHMWPDHIMYIHTHTHAHFVCIQLICSVHILDMMFADGLQWVWLCEICVCVTTGMEIYNTSGEDDGPECCRWWCNQPCVVIIIITMKSVRPVTPFCFRSFHRRRTVVSPDAAIGSIGFGRSAQQGCVALRSFTALHDIPNIPAIYIYVRTVSVYMQSTTPIFYTNIL